MISRINAAHRTTLYLQTGSENVRHSNILLLETQGQFPCNHALRAKRKVQSRICPDAPRWSTAGIMLWLWRRETGTVRQSTISLPFQCLRRFPTDNLKHILKWIMSVSPGPLCIFVIVVARVGGVETHTHKHTAWRIPSPHPKINNATHCG